MPCVTSSRKQAHQQAHNRSNQARPPPFPESAALGVRAVGTDAAGAATAALTKLAVERIAKTLSPQRRLCGAEAQALHSSADAARRGRAAVSPGGLGAMHLQGLMVEIYNVRADDSHQSEPVGAAQPSTAGTWRPHGRTCTRANMVMHIMKHEVSSQHDVGIPVRTMWPHSIISVAAVDAGASVTALPA